MKSPITRREFVKSAVAVTASAGLLPKIQAAPSAILDSGQITLAGTGIKVSRIAMGTGFNGFGGASNQTRLGKEEFKKLIFHGYDQGLNFLDMADQYGSHHYMKEVLKDLPREKLTILSKIWFSGGGGLEPTGRAIPSVDRFLGELEIDHLDICLIHCVQEADWPADLERMRDEMSRMKEQGKIRAVGVSCHSYQALRAAVESPWTDIIFARINNRGRAMDRPDPAVIAPLLAEARKKGKAVVGMKIFGAGKLTTSSQRMESIRYVWGNGLVDAITIGFEQKEHIDDSIKMLNTVITKAS
jgi:1-deoxyxylulose-5-phosphate synthase